PSSLAPSLPPMPAAHLFRLFLIYMWDLVSFPLLSERRRLGQRKSGSAIVDQQLPGHTSRQSSETHRVFLVKCRSC
ncbi:hypothetical protein HYDPIDRAFT_114493, partial [Hydnomerulius pinastri MD-312]